MAIKTKGILYFLGIGGIGMSALARYFIRQSYDIVGYDLQRTPLTRALEQEGMRIHYKEAISEIPSGIEKVIYTSAIPASNIEFRHFVEQGIPMMKRAEVIGEISRQLTTLAIAGTHGKTSITAMIAHILHTANFRIAAFIGGISKNFQSNFFSDSNPEFMVVEADEFDRSFLKLYPDKAVITSMDADHMDIYSDIMDLQNTFVAFANRMNNSGLLVSNIALTGFENIAASRITYGLTENADVSGRNIRVESGHFCFDLWQANHSLTTIKMQVPGKHYVENALASFAIASSLGIDPQTIKMALESYKGVERRFDYRINDPGCVYIDDYAHHPEELRKTIQAAQTLYPDKKLTGIFQPHLFSRTRDFADDFAQVLEKLDRLILLDIYQAREKPIEGVSSRLILDKVKNTEKYLMSKEELLKFLSSHKQEVVLSMGAGDIGIMVNEIEKSLKEI